MNSINSTYRFIALTMAFLLFTSSVGFSIDMHYCQGELKSFSFLGKAETCHDKQKVAPKPKGCKHHQKMNAQKMEQENKNCSMDEKNCCENKTMYFQANLDEQTQASHFIVSAQVQQFVAAYVNTFVLNDFSIESETTTFLDYQSPLIARDIHVLVESFLL